MTLPEAFPDLDFDTDPASPCLATEWFARRFDAPLPSGLRELAAAMSWERFVATYGQTAGPVRLRNWACTDGHGRLGPQVRTFEAMIAVGERISVSTAAAGGPIAALSAMLHERGVPVEILRFHQLRSAEHTATFVRGGNGARVEWAMGWAEDPTQSALRAVIACANRLIA
ncbi:homocitrate synthase [Mycobacterium sp. E3247]|uniref:homocitrate synthase n=1 Tax=Mycobacterium sp. E3247 TaxID=1856864 RepID=UPI0007FBEB9A|nr:homocitrate synthase [Mycobacterium sp. E3247]OBH04419.1 homocitrate synthase [Mycobacterium sp. E3247]